MTVGHGELVAIIGGAGSGATTLLDAMSGLRPPTSGTVIRPGGDGQPPGPAPAGACGSAGYVSAGDSPHPALPLARALRYAAALRAVPGGDGAVATALAAAGLGGRSAAGVGTLGPGEQRRAAIAAALLSRPDELFLDQPTAGLDPAQAADVLRLLRRLADRGVTVLLSTSSPLDAAPCDKVAVMAPGGHLAFFGTPSGALGYFGADSLEEICERLAGLGDPAAAWSRRFYPFSSAGAGPVPGFGPAAASPLAPGPSPLVPDSAGPHSAGPVTTPARAGSRAAAGANGAHGHGHGASGNRAAGASGHGANGGPARRPAVGDEHPGGPPQKPAPGRALVGPARQLAVLIRRNADVMARIPAARAVLAAAPAAVLLAFAVLIGAGAFDAAGAGAALPVLGGFGIGLAYGLLQARGERGVLRAERFAGLSAGAYIAARLAVLLPLLAAADAVALAVPAACGRLPHGYGPAYLTMLLGSAVALTLATAYCAAGTAGAAGATPPADRVNDAPAVSGAPVATVAAALWRPALLLAGALLTLLDRPSAADWLALAALAVAAAVTAVILIRHRVPAAAAAG